MIPRCGSATKVLGNKRIMTALRTSWHQTMSTLYRVWSRPIDRIQFDRKTRQELVEFRKQARHRAVL